MQAFFSYGGRCNGCSEYAEECNCLIDDKGNLVDSKFASPHPSLGNEKKTGNLNMVEIDLKASVDDGCDSEEHF